MEQMVISYMLVQLLVGRTAHVQDVSVVSLDYCCVVYSYIFCATVNDTLYG